MAKVMVVAGEVSGDMHAARVVREIKRLAPDTEFIGMGSTHLQDEGVEIIIDPTDVSTIGFFEALKNLKTHLSHLKILSTYIDKVKPDVIFLVDYSGFNMRMAQIARKKGIPVVNYFAPTAWVWGKWRARWMARNKAVIASVFPMEREVYLEAGARVEFVGHPLLDIVEVVDRETEIYKELELDSKKPVIGLLPGSRQGEIEKLLPGMLEAAERLQQDDEDIQFVLPLAKGVEHLKLSEKVAGYNLIVRFVEDYTYQVLKIADLVIAASGTATLEAAILQTPMVIVYKTSSSTYRLGKLLVKLDHIGLPNIIAGREIVPELLQEEAESGNIYQESSKLLKHSYLLENMEKDLKQVRDKLGNKGAVVRTAKLVLKEGDIDYRVQG